MHKLKKKKDIFSLSRPSEEGTEEKVLRGILISTPTALPSSNTSYKDALFYKDEGPRYMTAERSSSSYREQRARGSTVEI